MRTDIVRLIGTKNIQQAREFLPLLAGKPGVYKAQFSINPGEMIETASRLNEQRYPGLQNTLNNEIRLMNHFMPRTYSKDSESIIDIILRYFKNNKISAEMKTLTMDEQGIVQSGKINAIIDENGIIRIIGKNKGENNLDTSLDIKLDLKNLSDNELKTRKNFLEGITYQESEDGRKGHLLVNITDAGIIKEAKGEIEAPAEFLQSLVKSKTGLDLNKIEIAKNEAAVKLQDYEAYQTSVLG